VIKSIIFGATKMTRPVSTKVVPFFCTPCAQQCAGPIFRKALQKVSKLPKLKLETGNRKKLDKKFTLRKRSPCVKDPRVEELIKM
jgi:hypothetical protein